MNYRYKKENKRKEVIIIYIVCIIILILTIISNTSILMKEMKQASEDSYIRLWIVWLGSMIGVILFDVFSLHYVKLFETERNNFIKWKNYLLNDGIKVSGVVKEIKYINQDKYKLRIGYFSELYKKDIEFETSIINIPNLDYSKKILCDVYESREYKPMGDYDAEDMKISENGIELTVNPFKLYKVIEKKYKIDWFGNAVAVDFHYENE